MDEGEKIGVVSNYLDHPNGTSRHLHFDVQVFTRDGWVWVSPYVTLVSSYERLIRGAGREIEPEVAASPADSARAAGGRHHPRHDRRGRQLTSLAMIAAAAVGFCRAAGVQR